MMNLSREVLENRKKEHRCLLCGSNLNADGDCIENPYHTNEPS